MHVSLRIAFVLCIASVGACSRKPESAGGDGKYEKLVLRYEGTTNNVTYPELAEDLGYLAPLKLEYIGNNATGGPHSIQSVVTGDIDFGSSFNGAIIKLIAAKAPLRAVLASYGTDEHLFSGFYQLESSPVRDAQGLVGKKVAMNTLGAHAEFVLKDYLRRGGLSAQQVSDVTMLVLPPVNGEQALRNRQVDVASFNPMLRDRALQRGGIRMLFSDYELYGAFNAGSFVMSHAFLAKHPNTARKFVQAAGAAIEWARTHPREEVIARLTRIITTRKRNEDTSMVRYWRSTGIATERGRIEERDYQLWIDWLVRDGQLKAGQVKAKEMFTNEFNVAVGELARSL